jgi:hypothetical protein
MTARALIGLVGLNLTVLWAPPGEAQQLSKVPRIGVLATGSPAEGDARAAAFRQGLRELGCVEEQTVTMEFRWAPVTYRAYAVSWNLTQRCNLFCAHCYISAAPGAFASGQLTAADCCRWRG